MAETVAGAILVGARDVADGTNHDPRWMGDDLAWVLAQLRHAYAQSVAGQVGDQVAFARGLLGPVIARLEGYAATAAAANTPAGGPVSRLLDGPDRAGQG